jgi:hypothetical protein
MCAESRFKMGNFFTGREDDGEYITFEGNSGHILLDPQHRLPPKGICQREKEWMPPQTIYDYDAYEKAGTVEELTT